MPLRALIFDFDGLMVDTETSIFEAYRDIFAEHGAELPIATWEQIIGSTGTRDRVFPELERQIGHPVDRDALREKARAFHHDAASRMPAVTGVAELIADARDAGLHLGVASSSTSGWVMGHLDRLGLAGHFGAVCTREDVQTVKPDPALYRLAAERLGVDPHEAVALEDSPNGIASAKAAGLFCVAVPSPITARMKLDHADMLIDSLSDLRIPDLAARLSPISPL